VQRDKPDGVNEHRAQPVRLTPGVATPTASFVHATVIPAGCEMVLISGQTPEGPDGTVPEGFEEQARQAWQNLIAVLAAAGCTLDDVAKISMYIRNREYRSINTAVRNEYLGSRTPALTVLVCDHWDERWLIEIEVIATREH
jgi:2-iminobutanoate/2-iminopropanoate deaminase